MDSSSEEEDVGMSRKTKSGKRNEVPVQSPTKQARHSLFDPYVTDVADGEAPEMDENNNDQARFDQRQPSPSPDTPRSAAARTPDAKESDRAKDGAPWQYEDDQQCARDKKWIRSALEAVRGLQSTKAPDLENVQQRVGQDVKVVGEEINFNNDDEVVPERPAEHMLRRLTREELAPLPQTASLHSI